MNNQNIINKFNLLTNYQTVNTHAIPNNLELDSLVVDNLIVKISSTGPNIIGPTGPTGASGISIVGPTGASGISITGPTGSFTPLGTNYGNYVFWNSNTSKWSVGDSTISLGSNAGSIGQSINAISIGNQAGTNNQGTNSISIGNQAGTNNQGYNSIAIGNQAGNTNQNQNSIILNASGNALNSSTTGLFINPIRQDTTQTNLLNYNTTTSEITYQPGVWYDFTPSITGAESTITCSQVYGRYTVIGKTCIGNGFVAVSSIVNSGGVDALEFTLPLPPHSSYKNESTGTASIGAGSITIRGTAQTIPPYPNKTLTLNVHPVGNNLPRCRLWYSAINTTTVAPATNPPQTYLEDDFLPTFFWTNSSTPLAWNGFDAANIAFNFTYEIE